MSDDTTVKEDDNFEENKALVESFRPIDDPLFEVMARDIPFCQELLQIVLEEPELIVRQVIPQYSIHNLHGRSVRLDALCELPNGIYCNVEVQKSNNDDHVRRVRYNEACITASKTAVGADFIQVPDVKMVFISQFDPFKKKKTIYHIDRKIRETGDISDNGVTEVYVNTKIDDGTNIAAYMQYFLQKDVNDVRFPELSKRIKEVKGSEEGVNAVCAIVEEQITERDKVKIKSLFSKGVDYETVKDTYDNVPEIIITELYKKYFALSTTQK